MAKIRQNDRLPPYQAYAYTAKAPVDLTAYSSLSFKMVHSSGSPIITGSAVGDAQGNLSYPWASGDTAVPGMYAAVFKGIDSGGKVQTFPTDENLSIEIVPAI